MNPLKMLKKLQKKTFRGSVVIVGAGAAGLYAGWLLRQLGVPFQILEASAVHGGRLAKLEGFAEYPIDLGAQWLHGKKSIAGDWVKEQEMKIKADPFKSVYWLNGSLESEPPFDFDLFEDDDLPDISYRQFARELGLGEAYDGLITALAGDLGASPDKLSVYYNTLEFEEWKSGSTDYKFRDTFYDLIDRQLYAEVRDFIRFNTAVTEIAYGENGVVLTDASGFTYQADKVILTVPITILQAGDIRFTPALPFSKTQAFSKLGMEPAIKVFLKFRERFFDANTFGGNICAAYIDEQCGKKGGTPVLLAYLIGDQAEKLAALGTDEAMTQALLAELDEMYEGKASRFFEAVRIQNWTAHPWIRGGYSYSTCGMANARFIAAKPVANRLYFAGEAMNTRGHHQSVHGALETSLVVVREIVKSIKT